MDIILIPGLWLDASSWDAVVPAIERAGHRAHPLTLPGMESKEADRSHVTLQDHIYAVVAAIDAVDGEVVLVGHSAGGGLAHAAVDARPDRVNRVVYVGGEPRGTDEGGSGFPTEGADAPLPDWSFFDDEMVADLDPGVRERIRGGSVPSPVHAVTDGLDFGQDGLYDVPVTMITAEYDSEQLRKWIDAGEGGTEEMAKLRNAEWVDLHSGHWPQFSRVDDVARLIGEAAART